LAEGHRSIIFLHIYWIPILPIGTSVRWFCRQCGLEIDARRPSRPSILIGGVMFAVFMTLIGSTMLGNLETRPAGIVALALGPVLAGALSVMIRQQCYRDYAAAVNAVVPLDGRQCPVCGDPLLAGTKPRCYSCKVDIITE